MSPLVPVVHVVYESPVSVPLYTEDIARFCGYLDHINKVDAGRKHKVAHFVLIYFNSVYLMKGVDKLLTCRFYSVYYWITLAV